MTRRGNLPQTCIIGFLLIKFRLPTGPPGLLHPAYAVDQQGTYKLLCQCLFLADSGFPPHEKSPSPSRIVANGMGPPEDRVGIVGRQLRELGVVSQFFAEQESIRGLGHNPAAYGPHVVGSPLWMISNDTYISSPGIHFLPVGLPKSVV